MRARREQMTNKIFFGIQMCMYKLCRGNKRKGFGDFWEAKGGLTRCAREGFGWNPRFRKARNLGHPRFESIFAGSSPITCTTEAPFGSSTPARPNHPNTLNHPSQPKPGCPGPPIPRVLGTPVSGVLGTPAPLKPGSDTEKFGKEAGHEA